MAARTPRDAIRNFVEGVQKSISCVTDSILRTRHIGHPTLGPQGLSRAAGNPVPLHGTASLLLKIRAQCQVIASAARDGTWVINLTAYSYTLADMEEREILAYHWQPKGASDVSFPHLHIGPAAGIGRRELIRAHLPTGRVDLNDFRRLLIREFGVRPRRKDWSGILGTN